LGFYAGDFARRRRAKFVPGDDRCMETTMKPSLPRTLSAVPHALHVQLEIAKAIRTFAAQDENVVLQRRTEIAVLRHECEAVKRDMRKFEQEWLVLLKAELRSELKKYSPDQPRVPAGNSGGGQWTKEGESRIGGEAVEGTPAQRTRLADATNDNLTPEQTCQQAYVDAVALARINPSLSPTDYLKVRREIALSLDDCLDLAHGDRRIAGNGTFVFFHGGGIVSFRPSRPPTYAPPSLLLR
jgi:hypothetical protein